MLVVPLRVAIMVLLVALVAWPELHELDRTVYYPRDDAWAADTRWWNPRDAEWEDRRSVVWNPYRKRRIAGSWGGCSAGMCSWHWRAHVATRVDWVSTVDGGFRLMSREASPQLIVSPLD